MIDHNSSNKQINDIKTILERSNLSFEILNLKFEEFSNLIENTNEEKKEVTNNQKSNMSNIHQSLVLSKEICEDLTYFVEDDYIHEKNSLTEMLFTYEKIASLTKKELIIWGSGKAKRELMFVEDFADALVFFMNKKIKQPFLNIGTGKDFTIRWYANFLMKKMNIKLNIKYDKSKPDGMPKKCLDITLAKKYGWKPKNNLDIAFKKTYEDFLKRN